LTKAEAPIEFATASAMPPPWRDLQPLMSVDAVHRPLVNICPARASTRRGDDALYSPYF